MVKNEAEKIVAKQKEAERRKMMEVTRLFVIVYQLSNLLLKVLDIIRLD